MSADEYCGTEILRRIALGKQAFMNKKKLFTGSLSIELKKRIVNRWRFLATFLGPFAASRLQHISDLHSKFALGPVW